MPVAGSLPSFSELESSHDIESGTPTSSIGDDVYWNNYWSLDEITSRLESLDKHTSRLKSCIALLSHDSSCVHRLISF